MKKILSIIAILSFISCTKYDEEQIYIIEKGSNSCSNSKYSPKTNPEIRFPFIFTQNHRYLSEIPDDINKLDINKLYGLTSTIIHNNSCRIGWRELENGNFEILGYWYLNGKREFEHLYEAKIGESLDLIVSNHGNYRFYCNGNELIIPANIFTKSYRTFPYFGGNNLSPHTMYFKIIEL